MALWIGIATFLLGSGLWYHSQRHADSVPGWLPRLGVATASLGIGTMALTQPGLPWMITSMCFSLVAIVILIWVIIEARRR